jgi:DNA polymerase-1
MIDADEYIQKNNLGDKVRLLLQIHDELVFEIDESCEALVAKDLVATLEKVLQKRNLSDLPLVVSAGSGKNLKSL